MWAYFLLLYLILGAAKYLNGNTVGKEIKGVFECVSLLGAFLESNRVFDLSPRVLASVLT